jgi:NAD(P)H dehydrogenase (quinone)
MFRFVFALLAVGAAAAQQPTVRILVSYHSESGNTARLADAIRKGATLPGVSVTLKPSADVADDEVTRYDGIVFGAPVHWQSASADGKRFLDRVAAAYQKAKLNGDGRTAGVFCTAGAVASGKDLARLSMIAEFLAMRFTIIGGVDSEGYGTLGPQATTAGKPGNVAAADLEEARVFGERFARLTRQYRSGSVKP